MMQPIEQNIERFSAMDLEKADAMGLMRRYDTKYVFHADQLKTVLGAMKDEYGIVENKKKRIFTYQTLYFDTDDYFFYRQHHDKKLSRYKIRCRTYRDSEKSYVEVKCKTNKRKTVKDRLLIDGAPESACLGDTASSFVREHIHDRESEKRIDRLKPVIWVGYRRIALTNPETHERITLDLDLTFSDEKRDLSMDRLVVAELKQPRVLMSSHFSMTMKDLGISPAQFSKYCMGVIFLGKSKRYNRFKESLLFLEKNRIPLPFCSSMPSIRRSTANGLSKTVLENGPSSGTDFNPVPLIAL